MSLLEAQAPAPDAGPLLRCAPIVLAHARDRNACLQAAREQSAVTHPQPPSAAVCAFLAALLWHLLHGMPARQALQRGLMECGDLTEGLAASIQQAPGRLRERLRNDGLLVSTLEVAVWGLLTSGSYAEALTRVANLGERATVATALVGALAGAAYRQSAIQADWRRQIHGLWPAQRGQLWRESELGTLAERLVQAGSADDNSHVMW